LLATSTVEAILANSAGLRYPLQLTIWPMFTRLVSRDSAAVAVHASNTVFLVGSGTVWRWSNNQIESHDPASAAFATAVIASHCSTGSAIPVRSIRQPCGTKMPKRVVMTVSLVHLTDRHQPGFRQRSPTCRRT
jgi:hypothetical protein